MTRKCLIFMNIMMFFIQILWLLSIILGIGHIIYSVGTPPQCHFQNKLKIGK